MPTDPPALARINGIGPQRAELLAKLGLLTHEDLLHYVPRRHEDRRHLIPLSEAQEGVAITVRGKVHRARGVRWGALRLEATIAPAGVTRKDDILVARWYAFRPWGIKEGCELFLYGRVTRDKKGHWLMKQPEYEIVQEDAESHIHIDRVAPVYALTDGLTQRIMRRIMFEATQRTPFEAPGFYPEPPGLMPREEAFRVIHFPETLEREERARQRLAYDEFFVLQCVVAQRRLNRVTGFRARPKAASHDLTARWLKSLPFPLTGAQTRVMK
jgi:ATP-dependent DNA helicase RecG